LLAGGAIGIAAGDDPPSLLMSWTRGEKVLIYGAVGALVGMLVGRSIDRRETWRLVRTNQLRTSFAPAAGGGVGAEVSIGF
jgi:hypothetical protein